MRNYGSRISVCLRFSFIVTYGKAISSSFQSLHSGTLSLANREVFRLLNTVDSFAEVSMDFLTVALDIVSQFTVRIINYFLGQK